MDSFLNSTMEILEDLSLGPIELVVLAAVITVSLCYLFSKGKAPSHQKVITSTRSISNTSVGKQHQRGIDSHESTSPTVDHVKSEQARLNSTDSSSTPPPPSGSGDDYDEQEDKCVPDFLSDASSTTTDSDMTAVGTTEQLLTKEHAVMDDNANLVDEEKAKHLDMEQPTTHVNTDVVSQDNKTQVKEYGDEQEGSDDKTMAVSQQKEDHQQPIDRHMLLDTSVLTGATVAVAATATAATAAAVAVAAAGDDDEQVTNHSPMDPSTDTQQTALQSVTENLDGAETDQFDMKNINDDVDMCNPAVITENGATNKDTLDVTADDDIVGEEEEQDQSNTAATPLLDTAKDAPTLTTVEDDDTMMAATTQHEDDDTQEEETTVTTTDSASLRLEDDATSEHNPSVDVATTEPIPDEEVSADYQDYDATAAGHAITVASSMEPPASGDEVIASVWKNSGDVASIIESPTGPCDQDLDTAVHEKDQVVMTTTTRSVMVGLNTEQQAVVTDDDKDNKVVVDLFCEKASICTITEDVVNENSSVDQMTSVEQEAQVNDETDTVQREKIGQDGGDTATTRGMDHEDDGQCTGKDNAPLNTVEHALTLTNITTTMKTDNLAASVQSAHYEILNGLSPYPPNMISNPTNKPKQDMSRIERIGQQRQPYIPLYKSRCTFWPGCTNNHCKYYHPFIECRNGKTCEFGKKCVFLHPKDYNDYQKHVSRKNKTKAKMNGKQSQKPETHHQDQIKMEQAS